MFIFSSILVYFFSIVIAISAMTFIVLLTMVNEISKRRQFYFLMSFCACNFLIETLYLCMTIQDSLLHYYHYNLLIRIADTALYTLQSFSWCRYLLYFPSRNSVSDTRGRRLCNILTGISLVLGIVSYAFLVDNEFLFTSSLGVIFDLIVSLLLSIMLICTAVTRRRSDSSFNRFNLIISCMLILIQWWTSIFMVFESHISFSFEIHEYLGGATQQMLVILALAIYVYKTDYSGVTLRQQLQTLLAKNAAKHTENVASDSLSTAYASDSDNASSAVPSSHEPDASLSELQPVSHDTDDTDGAVNASSDISVKFSAHGSDTGNSETAGSAGTSKAAQTTASDKSGNVSADMPDTDAENSHFGSEAHFSADSSDVLSSSVPGDSEAAADLTQPHSSVSHDVINGSILSPDTASDDSLSDIERIFDEKQLTKREREVARLAYTGLTNPEIADKLCISQHTVKRHMHSIFEKLNISARIELVHLMNRM